MIEVKGEAGSHSQAVQEVCGVMEGVFGPTGVELVEEPAVR